ncbi:MAG TPA: hypothetical protein VGM88_03805 [Kofleriaceae bacterium]|jgi:hypothetical protein
MRTTILYVAIIFFGFALVPRWWAHCPGQPASPYGYGYARFAEPDIDVGLRDYEVVGPSELRVEELRELFGLGDGFQSAGRAAFYCGIAAAAACVIASELCRKRTPAGGIRLALAIPLIVALVSTLVFWGKLDAVHSLTIGFSPFAMLIALLLTGGTLAWPVRAAP